MLEQFLQKLFAVKIWFSHLKHELKGAVNMKTGLEIALKHQNLSFYHWKRRMKQLSSRFLSYSRLVIFRKKRNGGIFNPQKLTLQWYWRWPIFYRTDPRFSNSLFLLSISISIKNLMCVSIFHVDIFADWFNGLK